MNVLKVKNTWLRFYAVEKFAQISVCWYSCPALTHSSHMANNDYIIFYVSCLIVSYKSSSMRFHHKYNVLLLLLLYTFTIHTHTHTHILTRWVPSNGVLNHSEINRNEIHGHAKYPSIASYEHIARTLLLSEIIFPHAINITDQIHQNFIHMLIYVDISKDFFLYVSILLTGFCAVI